MSIASAESGPALVLDPVATNRLCPHCDQPLGLGSVGPYCCRGCQAVYQLLHSEELDRYYQLRGKGGVPAINLAKRDRDLSWLAEAERGDEASDSHHFQLDVQGMHCSGCVWILQKTFAKQPGALKILVNPALGGADLWITDAFDLPAWIHNVERFGYLFGPRLKTQNTRSDALLVRLGICSALALNVMMLSAALYLGLSEGRLYVFIRNLSYVLASISVLVGGPVFFRSAWVGLQNRVLHMDVPISLGIILAYLGSSWAFWSQSDRALYLDTVSVFVALMLLGRYLQERILVANRMRLLASDGTAGLRSRRVVDGRIEIIKSADVHAEDQLSIAPGDLVPVDARLLSDSAVISLEWIRGESRQIRVGKGERMPAGAFNVGSHPALVQNLGDFSASPLQALLQGSVPALEGSTRPREYQAGFMRVVASYYVAGVLLAATIGFVGWWFHSGSLTRALEVATAVLVVTCPCAFGIATPLAHEMVQARLRRVGFYLRSGSFLARAQQIKTIVFDKTGTLTTGLMQLANPEALASLSDRDTAVLSALVSQSSHPSSMAIYAALPSQTLTAQLSNNTEEIPGMGLRCLIAGKEYRVGRASWACQSDLFPPTAETVFACDGVPLVYLRLRETLRSDAAEVIGALKSDGYDIYLLSGDAHDRVIELAHTLSIPAENAIADCSPEDKRDWLVRHDHGDLLFLGDGINDSLAAQEASFSGTPALDRPFMASTCDFYLGTETLRPVYSALQASHSLASVIRRNLGFALTYNALAVGLAWAGLMQPWLAALLMPASSILIVLATTHALSSKKLLWTS